VFVVVKARRIVLNAKTGKKRIEIFDFTPLPPIPEPKGVDLEELAKLIEYAKRMGWI